MKKIKYTVIILCCCVLGNVFAASTNFKSKLTELRDVIDKYMEAKDGGMQYLMDTAKLKVEISAIVSSDPQAKALLIKEIKDFAAKEFVKTDNALKVRPEKYVYHSSLLEILSQVDENEFLNYVKQVSKSKDINDSFKMNCLRLIDNLRMTHIKSPELLKHFDLKMKEIYSNFLDPKNGIKERNKLMRIKRRFISHLLGYELVGGKVKIPAADKVLGLKLAKDVVDNDQIQFLYKKSFMKEFAKYDSYILEKYLAGLREYTYNEEIDPSVRLKFARELEKHEKLKKGLIEELEKEIKDNKNKFKKK